jgi:hypothetical protein
MRKGISLIFVFVMMLSAAQFTIAIHFCGGTVAASKISLSGKLASCGMESEVKSYSLPGNHITKHCCDNQITTVGILNIFTAPVSFNENNIQNIQKTFYTLVSQLFHSITATNILYTSFNPPGELSTCAVSLPDICVFRI